MLYPLEMMYTICHTIACLNYHEENDAQNPTNGKYGADNDHHQSKC